MRAWRLAGLMCAAAVVAGVLGCKGAPPPPPAAKLDDVIVGLHSEVDDLETVNRMQLSPQQAQELSALVTGAQELQAAEAGQRKAQEDLVKLLEQQRDTVAADTEPSPLLLQEIRSAEGAESQAGITLNDATRKLGAQMRAVLSHEQIAIGTNDVHARMQATEVVEGYRDLPDESFEREIAAFSQELAGDNGSLTASQIEALFREVRSLSEQEYRKQRTKLVEQVAALYAPSGAAADSWLGYTFTRPAVTAVLASRAGGSPGSGAPTRAGK